MICVSLSNGRVGLNVLGIRSITSSTNGSVGALVLKNLVLNGLNLNLEQRPDFGVAERGHPAAATKSQPHQTAELPRLRRNRHIVEETRCISTDKEKIQQKERKRNT